MNDFKIRFWSYSTISAYHFFLIISFFLSGLNGCSPNFSSTIISLTKNKFEQTDPSNVKIFVSERPKDAYQEICLVRVPVFRKKKYDLDDFKFVAAQQGADAIINTTLSDNFVSGVAIKWR